MTTAKKVTKKVTKPKVELVSYSIRMVIPTGQYANIQPEIVVKSNDLEEAHAYVAPHMNKLWKEYFMISERKVEPTPSKTVPVQPVTPAQPVVEASPVSDVAFTKATQAIQSCLSADALDLIIKQIGVSTKLTDENKKALLPLIEDKSKELNG